MWPCTWRRDTGWRRRKDVRVKCTTSWSWPGTRIPTSDQRSFRRAACWRRSGSTPYSAHPPPLEYLHLLSVCAVVTDTLSLLHTRTLLANAPCWIGLLSRGFHWTAGQARAVRCVCVYLCKSLCVASFTLVAMLLLHVQRSLLPGVCNDVCEISDCALYVAPVIMTPTRLLWHLVTQVCSVVL